MESSGSAELKAFVDGAGKFQDFGFIRYWWAGDGPRSGIAQAVLKKRQPMQVASGEDAHAETAARSDIILPASAPNDYMVVEHLLARFDATLPFHECHTHVQVTLRFPDPPNLHRPWEEARQFAREYFAIGRGLAVLLFLHAPHQACSGNPPHAHLLIPVRRLGSLGFGEVDRDLPCDKGQKAVYAAWQEFKEEAERRP